MAVKTNYYDGNSVAAADLIAPWAAMLSDGVFGDNDFTVSAESPADLAVSVAIGRAVKDGHFIRSDAVGHVPIAANTSGYNRIDVAVLQVDDVNKATTLTVVQGTPSSSPTVPILQDNQLPLAQVTVGNNVSVIDGSAITDVRTHVAINPYATQNLCDLPPIGYMFEWSPVNGGPDLSTAQKVHDYYGFGTWALLGIGRTAVCIDTSDPNFDTAGKTYGEKTHTLTTSEMPKHTVTISGKGDGILVASGTYTTAIVKSGSMTSDIVGGDQPHNNIQPSIVVYRWQRVA